ncbi:protein CHAPERONE-LIKE PROTEIN OF POR1, chloroplastic [Lycium barbarum]|uniref:protein CHAPERONE-LIKE PROTEIN OF POR1, chloroplastic n=1 Tax=Lycium barbarum TaxID=112863 RepID=UPI00293F3DFB|nr:protein CHAPERONE-LIKE PROTEIN OF POR1, chloroplastic [Lycium barbarum]
MATSLSVRPNRTIIGSDPAGSNRPTPIRPVHFPKILNSVCLRRRLAAFGSHRRKLETVTVKAGSRADDSAPFEMSVENALKLLGVSEGASFDDILRAKKSIISTCNDDPDTIAQVEAAYDMLLMQSLSQRRAGKVVDSSVRFADVKAANASGMGSMPKWLQTSVKSSPVSVEAPAAKELGVQAGVYGALMVLTYVNGASTPSGVSYGADVPGLILATSFGATLYFMTKKNVKLGKASVITIGGLVAGAVVGSAVENWLQVDIVPFLGIHTPATVVSEFILFSQFLVSLYLI